jgi:hypothetical protein
VHQPIQRHGASGVLIRSVVPYCAGNRGVRQPWVGSGRARTRGFALRHPTGGYAKLFLTSVPVEEPRRWREITQVT